MILELHVLQNIAPANLNRDDTGSPKDAIFGGYRRARVSSQAWKRAMREAVVRLPDDGTLGETARTRRFTNHIASQIDRDGISNQEIEATIASLLKSSSQKEKLKIEKDRESGEWLTPYLFFLTSAELATMEDYIVENWDKISQKPIPQKSKVEFANILNASKSVDLALFGRMLADFPKANVDGAAQVAHAISTHAVEFEFDFYTAVDDLNTEEETGAGMMGTVEYNSATFYRYTNVDISQLSKNLNGDQDLIDSTIRAYAEAFLTALPTGKQNSFAAQNPPSFAVAIVRDKGRWSLANAFVDPVATRKGDLIGKSIASLTDYWGRLSGMYGADGIHATPVLVDPCYQAAATRFDTPSSGMTGWLDDISASLAQANGRS